MSEFQTHQRVDLPKESYNWILLDLSNTDPFCAVYEHASENAWLVIKENMLLNSNKVKLFSEDVTSKMQTDSECLISLISSSFSVNDKPYIISGFETGDVESAYAYAND